MDQRVATRKALTDAFCRGQPAPASGRLEFADLRCAGLSFRITSAGSRTFCFRFRDPLTRATTRATIGTYPDVGLGDARTRADAMRVTVAAGTNPVERRKGRAAASQRAFGVIAERFMTEHSRRKKRSADGDDRNLNLHVLPKWKNRQIDDIRRADVIELVEGIVTAGKPVLANRVQSLISSIFSFALDADVLSANPCARLRKRGEETAGTRILSDPEIRLFWRRSLLPPVSRGVGLAMRLQLLTGTRPSEAAEIDLNELKALNVADDARWTIPGERTKNKLEFLVPLSPMAVAVVQGGLEIIDEDDVFLFPSPIKRTAPIDGHALAVAMRRMAESDKLTGPGSKTWKADPPTPHDLRRTFATRLAELGVAKEDRDACLNHTDRNTMICTSA